MKRVDKAYMKLEGLLLLLLIIWDRRAVGVSLSVGWLSGTLADGTLGSALVSGVLVGVGGREFPILYCNALIARSFLSPIEKGYDEDGFSPPWPDPLLRGWQRWWRKKLGSGSYVGIILLYSPLSRSVYLVNIQCSIYSALGTFQGNNPTIHAGQR